MRIYAALRALVGADQATVAQECDLSVVTLANAEKGKASDKTSLAIMAYYARHGLSVARLPGDYVAIVWQGQGIGAADCQAGQSMRAQGVGDASSAEKMRVLPAEGVST